MEDLEQSAVGVSGYLESLRRDRDRFVALAFCAADLLFEVDSRNVVAFAAGARLEPVPVRLNGVKGPSVQVRNRWLASRFSI